MSPKPLRLKPLRTIGSALALTLLAPAVAAAGPSDSAGTGDPAHFIVVGPQHGGLERTADSVRAADGEVVQSWPEIGVLLATSRDSRFAEAVRGDPGVRAAGASRNLAEQLPENSGESDSETLEKRRGTLAADTASRSSEDGEEPLAAEQWDMRMINADEAHENSDSGKGVTVGVLDSGIDPDHPDLAANLDTSRSVGCTENGTPDRSRQAWAPTTSGHGTHVAGTVAAANNGVGISGVAPNATLVSIKVVNDEGFIYPGSAICGFMWAAEHGIDVTNSSYFIDPWYLWCQRDRDQAAVAEAVRRAVNHARGNDVLNVVAAGNSNWNLSKRIHDTNSPNNGGPTEDRWTGNGCQVLPGELPGMVTVSAVGPESSKSFYSNYGIGSVDVAAPGGDSKQTADTPSGNGSVLSTLPEGEYGFYQGTSMASPHVAGVAALIRAEHPRWDARMVNAALRWQADTVPCPKSYDTDGDGEDDAKCRGGRTGAGFYGAGIVDALRAVR
ncbi:Serine protease, subtilisin family [Actinopolyspora alba]|uniref:Serine protease, subtilisin family n=1 Tax=Actinopolyspora alba TaxID=673379 RepID=A0A1I1U1R9_9ACTN|nr:Serine protease, subtilisin family [Actinopolyspora alba]